MLSTQPKIWSREELLDLLDDKDIEALWDKWNLSPAKKKRREARSFADAVGMRSKTTMLQDVLSLRTPTLRMLRDVLTFLTSRHSALRTTGAHIVLDEEFELSPQQVDAALAWSQGLLRRHQESTWTDLRKRFATEILRLFETISDYGRVRITRRQEDLMKFELRRLQRGAWSPERRIPTIVTARYDREGLEARKDYVGKLADLNKKLAPLRERKVDENAQKLVADIGRLWREQDALLREDEGSIETADRKNFPSSGLELSKQDHEIWKRFTEDILFLSDLEESSSIADVLRMDLFRKRPQLYELWVMVSILNFMRRAGYKVEMRSLHLTESGRTVWNLNYAKSESAVARLFRSSDSTEYFLFYQLFRAGESRDDMPDIALLPSDHPTDRPVWIMDPKHSERGAYALKSYEKVALRYQRTFEPRRTWIVEYFPRPGLGPENPLLFAAGVELIRDVSPDGAGYPRLLRELEEFHGCAAVGMIAVVDVSGSFRDKLGLVKNDLRKVLADGGTLSDDIIWFADRAARADGCLAALEKDRLEPPADLGGGTRFSPALDVLEAVLRDVPPGCSLRIYTDGEFGDVSMEYALERLRRHAVLEVIDFQRA